MRDSHPLWPVFHTISVCRRNSFPVGVVQKLVSRSKRVPESPEPAAELCLMSFKMGKQRYNNVKYLVLNIKLELSGTSCISEAHIQKTFYFVGFKKFKKHQY